MNIGEKIRELRLENNLLQRELAAKVQIAPNTLSQFENGKANPSYEVLTTLADFFQCSTDYLLGRSDDFGNISVYQQTDNINSLSADEQKIIDAIRRTAPIAPTDLVEMYTELPAYMQETIFAELKGMYLATKVAKSGKRLKNKP